MDNTQAIIGIKETIQSWNYEQPQLLELHSEIMDDNKTCHFVYLVNEIMCNENAAYDYLMNLCGSEDGLYDCQELDDMVLDIIDELLG